ncbi:MAG: DUF547 domain-containing protein [Bacteroidota bacterium]
MSRIFSSLLGLLFFVLLSCGGSETSESANEASETTSVELEKPQEANSEKGSGGEESAEDAPGDEEDDTQEQNRELLSDKEPNSEKIAEKEQSKIKSTTKALEQMPKVEDETVAKPQAEAVSAQPAPSKPQHQAWDQLLQKYVSASGKVNYNGFKASQAQLQAYLDDLSAHPIQNNWSRDEKMAYWINAYNAFTVKLIVDNYPLSSITKLHGGKPWDVKWIKLGDKTYSLNNIENDILRPVYKDARIHFAVNCAALSCPPLLNQAWTAQNLQANLNSQARKFINNTQYNQVSTDKVAISKIFEWYAVDFGSSIVNYLNQYSGVKIKSDAQVSYQEYNWSLNQ